MRMRALTGKWLRTLRCLALSLGTMMSSTHAATYLDVTRVIISEHSREALPQLSNVGTQPVLFQLWVDRGDAQVAPELLDVPFVINQAIFRLESGQSQRVRILSDDGRLKLPRDRESLFWLNVLEVPGTPVTSPASQVQVAIQSRIKLFYRPAGLESGLEDSVKQLHFGLHCDGTSSALLAYNPSAFHHTLLTVRLLDGERLIAEVPVGTDGLLAPQGQHRIALALEKQADVRKATAVQWDFINDYGAVVQAQTAVAALGCS